MVIVCNNEYDETKYNGYFEKYPFELSDFQKYAIQGLIEGNDVLITAHTGSGKTLPAEFAIKYFHEKNKKTLDYCSCYTKPGCRWC